jgi:hypothetical protein
LVDQQSYSVPQSATVFPSRWSDAGTSVVVESADAAPADTIPAAATDVRLRTLRLLGMTSWSGIRCPSRVLWINLTSR